MNVNEIYNDISSFWDSIYPLILFHLVLYITYRFLFPEFSLKRKLQAYSQSDSFKSTKKLLEEFQMWTKLPFVLLISIIIYLALFNSLFQITGSLQLFPCKFVYSHDEFIVRHHPKEDLIAIVKYSNDKSGKYHIVNQVREKYLEEYKTKHPEKYKVWVEHHEKSFLQRLTYYNLTQFFMMALIVLAVLQIRKSPHKVKVILKLLFVVAPISVALLGILRYLTEQSLEQKFNNETIFVRSELEIDDDRKQIWTSRECDSILNHWNEFHTDENKYHRLFWLSRIIEENTEPKPYR